MPIGDVDVTLTHSLASSTIEEFARGWTCGRIAEDAADRRSTWQPLHPSGQDFAGSRCADVRALVLQPELRSGNDTPDASAENRARPVAQVEFVDRVWPRRSGAALDAALGSAVDPGAAALGGADDLGAYETVSKGSIAGSGIHDYCSSDGSRDPASPLHTGEPPPASAPRKCRERRAGGRFNTLSADVALAKARRVKNEPRVPGVGEEEVGPTAEDGHGHVMFTRPAECAHECLTVLGPSVVSRRTANSKGRVVYKCDAFADRSMVHVLPPASLHATMASDSHSRPRIPQS